MSREMYDSIITKTNLVCHYLIRPFPTIPLNEAFYTRNSPFNSNQTFLIYNTFLRYFNKYGYSFYYPYSEYCERKIPKILRLIK